MVLHQDLINALDLHSYVNDAVEALNHNNVSTGESIRNVQARLLSIMLPTLETSGVYEEIGTDLPLRASFVTFQGIVETALASKESDVLAVIVTPQPPTPLRISEGKTLSQVDIEKPVDFAHYRHDVLLHFLAVGGTVCSIHNEAGNFPAYDNIRERHEENMVDRTTAVTISPDITGAIYMLRDGAVITFESYQVNQTDPNADMKWAVKFGEQAVERLEHVQEVLGVTLRDFCEH